MNGHASFNRSYTVVWSDTHQAYVVTHEATRRKGKRSGTISSPVAQALLAAFAAFGASGGAIAGVAPTTVVPTGGNTVAYVSPNGVPVVDISTANAAGVSHNQFTQYSVGANGLVLNNGDTSQMARQSQLAGQVMANTNLNQEARVILNEVVSANRSVLAGFTEVVGGKADVIVANPYGITCSGCGYINTDRVTMTTGTPNFSPNGDLAGFTVKGGDILINGNGLNASAQQVLDLVARSVKLDGAVNASDLGITTGTNQWDYASRSVTGAAAATGAVPAYAIDSSALGGMYAGRIRILATEAGVGVRMLGDAAATADDFTLSAAGKVEIGSQVSAQRDLAVSTAANNTDALVLNNASLTAQRNASLSATQGGAQITGGALVAKQNLNVAAQTLSDNSSSASVQDNNKRYAGGNASVSVAQAAAINGTIWGAASALTASAGSLSVGGNGAQIYAGTTAALTATAGDLALNTAAVSAQNDLSLSANGGAIQTTAGAAQGVQSTAGNINVTAANGLNNGGVIDSTAGNVIVRANGSTNNSGVLHAKGNLDFADQSGGQGANLGNTGTVLAEGSAQIKANTLNNASAGKLQGSNIVAANLTNAGLLIASGSVGSVGIVTATNLTNTGTLQSMQDLNISSSNALQNMGSIVSQGAQSVSTAGLQNSGTLQSNGNQTLSLGSSTLTNTAAGQIIAGGTQQITAQSLGNDGLVQATGAQTLTIAAAASNTGTVLGKTSQTATLGSLTNSGTWQANQGGSLTVAGGVTNTGAVILSTTTGKNGSLTAQTVGNHAAGNIQSAGNLTLGITGAQLSNAGKVIAAVDLNLQAMSANVNVINANNAYLQAGGALNMTGNSSASLDNQAGGFVLGNALNVNAFNLTNDGTLQGGGFGSNLQVGNALSNSGTLTLATAASGASNVSAASINNAGTLQSEGASNITTGNTFTNSGTTVNAGNLTLRGANASYTVNNAGHLESLAALDIQGKNAGNGVQITVGKAGVLKGDSMLLSVNALDVQGDSSQGGMVNTSNAMAINAQQLQLDGSKSRIVAGAGSSSITTPNGFTNNGAIFSQGDMVLKANGINNTTTGGIAAGGNLTADATSGAFDNYGALYAGGNLKANTNTQFTNYANGNSPQGTMDAGGSITVTAHDFSNQSQINSAAGVSINLGGGVFKNNVSGDLTRTTVIENDSGSVYDRQTSGWCVSCAYNPVRDYYHETRDVVQKFVNIDPNTIFKPQIIAGSGSTLTVSGFSSGQMYGGMISGGTVNLSGNSGSTFVVDALSLETDHERRDWNTIQKWYGVVGSAAHSGVSIENDTGFITNSKDYATFGAGIFANTQLGLSGFGLTLNGSPGAPTVSPKSQGGAASSGVGASSGSATGAGGQSGVSGSATLSPALNFGGLTISLPTNPNGYFVTNQNPNAHYLVETNPLYAVGSNFVGSDYLAERYGYNPDQIDKRLGDSNYEAYLVRQQLIAQTGNNILNGQASESSQMKNLMDNAFNQSAGLGLQWGKAPTADQLKNLSSDIIWMVDTVVDGQKVLAPVVYLCAKTKDSIKTGAVISAQVATMNLASLTNTGGTISGSKSLSIVSQGDIKNLSGTIEGGDVAIQSVSGSITNETLATTTGNMKYAANTVVSNTAGIHATGNLSMDAKDDIVNKGAQISAGGNASLQATNITFDTIENKKASSTNSYSSNGLTSTTSTSTTTSTQQIKSGLTVGGNLNAKASNDMTLAGTDVNVAGGANLDAGHDLQVLARANSTTTTSSSKTSGIGVGGGVAGSQKTDHYEEHDRNVGTTINVGGDAHLTAGNDVTLEGSQLAVKGSGGIQAGHDVNVLDGKDRDYSTTTTTTTTFLKTGNGGRASATGNGDASTKNSSASAQGSGQAKASGSGGLILAQHETTTTTSTDQRSVASNISFGGDASVKAGGDLTLRGSQLSAGGNADVDATNINVLAGQNISTTHTSSSVTSVGFMGDSQNSAGAKASAGVSADKNGKSANIDANAQADAEASTKNTLALVKHSTSTQDTLDVTHTSSGISSGGNMRIHASNALTTVGSSIQSGGDMDASAKTMDFGAAQDVHETRQSSSDTSVGLYFDASASATGKANAHAGAEQNGVTSHAGGSASASGEAKVQAEAGLYGTNTTSNSVSGSTHAVTSSLKAGGNMTRNATDSIHDTGTAIEAGGDFSQSAQTITSDAAHDTTYASSNSTTNTLRIGVQGQASVSGSAAADADVSAKGKTQDSTATGTATAGAALRVSYENDQSHDSSASSTAVVSTIKAGGKVSSTSSGKTSLEGTKITSGGDAELNAGSLDYRAAANTSTSTTTNSKGTGELKIDPIKKEGSLSGGYGTQTVNEASSTAVVGGINSGGKLKINTTGDARLEGTQIKSAGGADLNVGGNLAVDAARNTQTTETKGLDVQATIGGGKSGGSKSGALSASGVYTDSKSSASQAVVSDISSGAGLNIHTGGSATLEGTTINTRGDANIDAKNGVNFTAARDTESHQSLSVSASLAASGSKSAGGTNAETGESKGPSSGKSGQIGAEGQYVKGSSSTAHAGSINAGGNLNIHSGTDANFEGTNISSGGNANISANRDVNFTAAHSTSNETTAGGSLSLSGSSGKEQSADGQSGSSSKSGALSASGNYSKDTQDHAAAGSITSGGNLQISSGRNANFEGTNLAADGNAGIDSKGNVNFTAAKSSSSHMGVDASLGGSGSKSTQHGQNGGAAGAAGTDAQNKPGSTTSGAMSASGNYAKGNSTTAEAGSITAGRNLSIHSGGDAAFEGTNIAAGGNGSISTGGNLTFSAAHSTSSDTAIGGHLSADGSSSRTGSSANGAANNASGQKSADADSSSSGKFNAGAKYSNGSSNTAAAGAIVTGGKLNIQSGKNASFEGTDIAAGGDARIAAKGDLHFNAANSTSNDRAVGVDVSGGASSSQKTGSTGTDGAKGSAPSSSNSKEGKLSVNYSQGSSQTAKAGSISSGGNLQLVSGGDTTLEGTQVAADGKAAINAGGSIHVTAVENKTSNLSVGVSVGGSSKIETGQPADGGSSGQPAAKPNASPADKAKDLLSKLKAKTTGGGAPAANKPEANKPEAVDPQAPRSTNSLNLGLQLSGKKADTAGVASISGGQGISMTAGKDVTMDGTQLNSGANTVIDAGGNVRLDAAKSSHIGGALEGSISRSSSNGGATSPDKGGKTGKVTGSTATPPAGSKSNDGASSKTSAKLKKAAFDAGSSSQGVSIQGAGDLIIRSGGQTTMPATQVDVGGAAKIQSVGGVESGGVHNASVDLGLKKPSVKSGSQDTSLSAAQGVSIETGDAAKKAQSGAGSQP